MGFDLKTQLQISQLSGGGQVPAEQILAAFASALAAPTKVTTSGATPTVAPGAGRTIITLGAAVTQLTIAGLDLDSAGLYTLTVAADNNDTDSGLHVRVNGDATNGNYSEIGLRVNEALATPVVALDRAHVWEMAESGVPTGQPISARMTIQGPTGAGKICFAKSRFLGNGDFGTTDTLLDYVGRFTPTANVASLVLVGRLKAGGQIVIE